MTLCASGGLPCDVWSLLSDGSGLVGRGPDDPLRLGWAAVRPGGRGLQFAARTTVPTIYRTVVIVIAVLMGLSHLTLYFSTFEGWHSAFPGDSEIIIG